MADVEQRAEAEAAHKGLSGGAARAYVGGVFNRIRQAHARGTTPGKGARHLNRAARKEARREAQNRRDRLTERANGEAFRLRARTRREEGRTTAAKAGKADDGFPEPTPLTPQQRQQLQARYDRDAGGRANDIDEITLVMKPYYYYNALFPDKEKRRLWYRTQSNEHLRDAASRGGMSDKGTRAQLLERLVQGDEAPAPTPTPQPAPTPAQPAAPKKLVPIKQFEGNFQLDATRTMDPEFIREYYGEGQMRTALELQTEHNLEKTIRLLEKRTGKEYRGPKTKAAMVNWILANG